MVRLRCQQSISPSKSEKKIKIKMKHDRGKKIRSNKTFWGTGVRIVVIGQGVMGLELWVDQIIQEVVQSSLTKSPKSQ